ncbi:f3016008-9893-44dc-b3b4-6ee4fb1a9657 [Thermothielavioides terrestris]|uniref:F3016008-9893-44dc-b3b4-6ee4fb1a9657 n=1 Tax=Thermothielavioides terrestris TaxID=2587410 RepID=A0A3S4AQY1_9PEZI|nr:f3016008-9893-44dc-b3b4-6ee4fb1a9657 [Thermothielavioides terrestris]
MDPSATIDPATGQPLPPDAIVRVLHITPKVHVYTIPRGAVATAAGYAASSWTADPRNHIFTARLRVLETSFTTSSPSPTASPSTSTPAAGPSPPSRTTTTAAEEPAAAVDTDGSTTTTTLKVDILLEDPSSGALFAAAPYTAPAAVEPATDSSRFFAVRVRDPTGRQKATLGVGFEERGEAFDFGVALQEAGRVLGWGAAPHGGGKGQQGKGGGAQGKGVVQQRGGGVRGDGEEEEEQGRRDLSLKEGETITVNLSGTRFGRRVAAGQSSQGGGGKTEEEGKSLAAFALPPPPPPSAREARAQKRLSAQQLGFDDGQFGEFA